MIFRNVANKSSQEASRLLRKISLVWQGVGYETISSELSASGSQRNRPPGKAQQTATSICIGFSRTAKLLLGEATRSKEDRVSSVHLIEVDVDLAFGTLHREDVDIANVSELHATSIFSVEVSGAGQCSRIYEYIYMFWYDTPTGRKVGLVPCSAKSTIQIGRDWAPGSTLSLWVGWLKICILRHICPKQEL